MKRRRQYPGATPYTDRHGRRRWRFRKGAFSAELGTAYGSDDFRARYEAALAGERTRGLIGAERTIPGSLAALIASFYASAEFLDLSPSTRRTYRSVIEELRERHGRKPVRQMLRRHVKELMAEKVATPGAANNRLKRLRQLLDHAVELEWRTDNPARGVKPLRTSGEGFHTWDEGEIARFLDVHGPGTLARRAMVLMLYTGAARVDAVALGWGNIRDGRLSYRRRKTARSGGVMIDIPVHPILAATLEECPPDAFTFLQTIYGASRSPNGLGTLMRQWCNAAGLPPCASHGLRKACATRLAEAGATAPELMAVTGHRSLAEAQRYIAAADRSDLADAAWTKLSGAGRRPRVANHPDRFAKAFTKPRKGDDE